MHITNEHIRLLFQKAESHCIAEIYKATGKVFYTEMSTMTEWPIHGIQEPHLDTYSNQEMDDPDWNEDEREKSPRREWTCILYLNDDYTGGETYFPPSDYYPFGTQIEKEVGDGLLFQGIYHGHGVFKVRRAPRHTLAIWFSEDMNHAMTQRPIENLDHNENSIRHDLQYRVDDLLLTDNRLEGPDWVNWKRQAKS